MLVYLNLQRHHEKFIRNGLSKNRSLLQQDRVCGKDALINGDAGTRDLPAGLFISVILATEKRSEELASNLTASPAPFPLLRCLFPGHPVTQKPAKCFALVRSLA
jgi:hypothetical protein